MAERGPTVVAVSGFSSNVGKTTLVCELLRALPGWEAIKLTRGHYRSCGRDPESCCVSDLLRDEAVIRSGREQNYETGKDTGLFWDAGAANVHWVIATDDQVESGIKQAIERVEAPGVIVEGNSFLEYVVPDLAVMCARAEGGNLKGSARAALPRARYLYLSSLDADGDAARAQFDEWLRQLTIELDIEGIPIITRANLSELVATILSARKVPVETCFQQTSVHAK